MGSHRRTAADTARNEQLERVLRLLRELDRLDGCDLYELAERHGVTTRTVRRDLDALRAAGLPIVETHGDGQKKRWRLDFHPSGTKVGGLLDASHYLAVRLAMQAAGPARSAPALYAALEDLSDKIEIALGKKSRPALERIERALLSVEKRAYDNSPADVFWPLIDAIDRQRVCLARYRAAKSGARLRTLEILPLKLFAHEGGAYVLCVLRPRGAIATLNLHRLAALEVTDERAEPPADFDPQRWISSAFGLIPGGPEVTYRLSFHPEVAPFIRERIWHPSQQLVDERDGGVGLAFACGESAEVEYWVQSWGRFVRVSEPVSLRRSLAALGAWYAKTYAPRRRKR